MSRHNKKNYSLHEFFDIGKLVARQRIELARKYDYEDINKDKLDIKEYILLREQERFRDTFAGSLGYIYGYWTIFCWSKNQLNEFDREISGLTNSAMEGLFS